MGTICQILFHNNIHGVYYAGQTISGQVNLSTDKVKEIKAIRLKLKGFAQTHWTESKTDSNNKSTSESFNGFHKYLSSTVYLLGSETSPEMTLEPGVRTYNFACQIPIHCPSSFEGTHGRIHYMVDVNIMQSWKYGSVFTRPFTVVQVMDMPTYQSVSQVPVQVRSEKTFGVWPFKSSPLNLELTLPQTGFVPGQTVPLKVFVGNESRIRVHEMKVGLAMMITYYSDLSSGTNSERISVAKLKADGVMRNSQKMYEFQLLIPSTPPTSMHLCRIIKIGYQIEVVAKVKGMHINGTLVMPVTICGVPIAPPMVHYVPEGSGASGGSTEGVLTLFDGEAASAAPAAPPYPWSENSTFAPPSYAEAMHIQSNPEKSGQLQQETQAQSSSDEKKPFKPLYPIYSVPSPTEEKKLDPALEKEEKK
ncbi:arrestin domain-containing protein 2 [Drosophila serrata]|uniref:arrestin domain-containing protein 2 n=1 Tax=Drosophila serrata TaxID=7274 RepID=UPI000A1D1025|nr:arrestin domain-containing protein 2 [Drosophila serrata]